VFSPRYSVAGCLPQFIPHLMRGRHDGIWDFLRMCQDLIIIYTASLSTYCAFNHIKLVPKNARHLCPPEKSARKKPVSRKKIKPFSRAVVYSLRQQTAMQGKNIHQRMI